MVFQSSPSMAKGMVGTAQGGTKGLEMPSNPPFPPHGAGKKPQSPWNGGGKRKDLLMSRLGI